ncbi:MAG: hypothetical protein IE890_13820, partial [Arcobacter sp.]|nr:hypothetical protein [Arcobacter sp.]
MTDIDIEKLKNIIQDSNINFLIGSGMSAEYLNTLGNIENLLTEVEKVEEEKTRDIIRVSL